ncbi:MAG: calcium-binding protein, partial [bacterium]|nr:calcium-binding protein [bacterium]
IEKQFHHNISPGLLIVEEIKFSNGVTWTQQDLSQAYIAQHQTSGADLIDGNYLDNTIAGGAGDDTLRGQEGDDRYVFQTGFGNDVVEEVHSDGSVWADDDTVEFGTGIARAGLQLARSGGDLVITFAGMTDRLTVHGQFEHTLNAPSFSDIERLVFSDGTVVTEEDIRLALLTQQVSSGADTIVGFYTNDTIDGAAGNDLLDGRGGSDTYLFGTGAGQDRISETLVTAFEDTPDTVAFGAGLTVSDLAFEIVGDNLVIRIVGGTDALTIEGQYASSGYKAVEQFSFASGSVLTAAEVKALAIASGGTTGADTITGTPGADTLDGKAGDDRLEGGGGNDVYVFELGSGNDTIHDVGTGTPADEVRFGVGILPADIVGERVGNDLVLRITGHTDTLTIEGHFGATFVASPIETFLFANGTTWGEPEILNLLYGSSTAIVGSQFNDNLSGTSGADALVGLQGSDTLSGGAGSDTYFVGQGSALILENAADSGVDTVRLTQFTAAGIAISRSGDDAILTYSGGATRLQGQFNAGGVEQIALAGGVTWTAEDLRGGYLAAAATSGADDIVGFNGRSDTLSGAGGNDTLSGRTGSDTYTYTLGSGEDLIIDGGDATSIDRLVFAVGIAPTDLVLVADSPATGDLTITFGNGAGKVVLRGELSADGSGVEEIAFSDGTVWNYATILDKADDAAPVGDQT